MSKSEKEVLDMMQNSVKNPMKAIQKICKVKDSNANKVRAIYLYCEEVLRSVDAACDDYRKRT